MFKYNPAPEAWLHRKTKKKHSNFKCGTCFGEGAQVNKGIFGKFIEPENNDICFSKVVDRRVAGSMNDLVFQAKVHLIEGQQSSVDVSFLLSESPMSYLSYSRPKDEFKKLFFNDGESSGNLYKRGAGSWPKS